MAVVHAVRTQNQKDKPVNLTSLDVIYRYYYAG